MSAFVCRVRTITTGVAGSPFFTNHYFESDPGSDDFQGMIDAVAGFWDDLDLYVSSLLTAVVQGDVVVIDTATGNQTTAYSGLATGHVFSDSGEILPLSTQGLIRWDTGGFTNGRRVRGKTFVFGPTETRSVAGAPNALYTNALQAAATALIAAAPAPLQIYSETGAASHDVTGAGAWSKWAVLRSRRD